MQPDNSIDARPWAQQSTGAEGSPCQNCGERPSVGMWVGKGSALDFNHGFYQWWCHVCMLRAQLEFALETAAKIPALKDELEAALANAESRKREPS